MSEFIREMEEDVRAMRLQDFWKKYGNTLIGISIAIVVGTAAGVAWKAVRAQRQEENTSALIAAGNKAEGLQAVIVRDRSFSHAALAGLRLGAKQREEGNAAEALKTYQGVSAGISYDEGLRALADIHAAYAASEAGDKQPPAETPQGAPLWGQRTESEAWLLLEQGNPEEAAKRFRALRDNVNTSLSQKGRVQMALSYLNAETPTEATPEPAAQESPEQEKE